MNATDDSSESIPEGNASAIQVTIIYEDFASGIRAKHFAEHLAESVGCACPLSESIWRSELLECPQIADHAARAAAACDYLIVSLRGEHVLPFAARRWIEEQLSSPARRNMGVILLSDSSQGKWRVLEGTRHYLRAACTAEGVDFFCHAVNPAGDGAARSFHDIEETTDIRHSSPRAMPALLPA